MTSFPLPWLLSAPETLYPAAAAVACRSTLPLLSDPADSSISESGFASRAVSWGRGLLRPPVGALVPVAAPDGMLVPVTVAAGALVPEDLEDLEDLEALKWSTSSVRLSPACPHFATQLCQFQFPFFTQLCQLGQHFQCITVYVLKTTHVKRDYPIKKEMWQEKRG